MDTSDRIVKKAYPVSLCCRNQVRDQIKSWLEHGIIEPTVSQYHHPLGIVNNNTNQVRICLDLTKVNSHTTLLCLKVSNIEDLFAKFQDVICGSSLDLVESYFQIEITENLRDLLSFAFEGQMFRACRMASGY